MSSAALTLLTPGPKGSFWLAETAATHAERVDGAFYLIYYLAACFFVLVIGTMITFCIRYRRRSEDQRSRPVEGSRRLQLLWSIAPALLLLVIFLWGFRDWVGLNVPPEGALDLRVTAKKWSWTFDYPGEGCSGLGAMVVPLDTPVKLTMSSRDVIHGFYVPEFRIKRDVLPNRYSVLWFQATKAGTYNVLCTEYCGTGHSRMTTTVTVVPGQRYHQWVADGCGQDDLPPVELGEKTFKARGCNACHSITVDRMALPGPPLAGKFGTSEQTTAGEVKFDESYVRESVLEPQAKVVSGYTPVMPSFKGQLSDKQINGLIEYIKTLK